MNILLKSAIAALVTTCTAQAATAALTTYADRASWQGAAGATIFEDLNAFAADDIQPFDVGPFTVSAVGAFAGDNGIEAYDPNPNDIQQDRNIDGTTYLSLDVDDTVITFTFDSAIFAIAWDQVSTVSNVDINIDGMSANLGSGSFFGIVSDTAFTSFTLTGIDGAFGLDNIEFSNAAAVPAPAAFGLFGLALLGLSAGRRFKR
ncbi:hypothetical protein KCG44_03190 [Pacificimonas sp. WHA3]|uniref:PEP-CTERM protein-sorting domain-containing protein n=1 Tax=Pacificimonas pallii TaxID=2827236 RepID=A0ABS6SBJ0_9SPHN|nr:hypothetical protein [Pacificimonas pallii]MBV7255787.1 hypothetical protein [Pacificimonas pallii]